MRQSISIGKVGYFITSSEAICVRARAAQQRRYVQDAGLAHGLFHAGECTRNFRNSEVRKILNISNSVYRCVPRFRDRLIASIVSSVAEVARCGICTHDGIYLSAATHCDGDNYLGGVWCNQWVVCHQLSEDVFVVKEQLLGVFGEIVSG
jgi:hypothetical protein